MPIQQDRLVERLNTLGQIGATPEGGVTRLAYTPEYRQAETVVRGWMEEAGLSTRTDAVGNLIGRREGTQSGWPCVMLASHIDTVINGGRYDGALGVLSAIETAQALQEDGVSLDAPLEVVAFMDEEGTRWKGGLCGSRAMVAELSDNDLQRRDDDQISMAEAMQAWGLDLDRLHEAIRDPAEIGSYLELHIEQGAVLESEGMAVGVVTGIAGLLLLSARLLSARLHGSADHAGATPMGPLRRDAMLGAAELALAAETIARETSPTCVATVGQLALKPGVFNIIPGEASLTFDVRDIHETDRDRAEASIREAVEQVAQKRGLTFELAEFLRAKPVPLSPVVIETVAAACTEVGLPAYRLPSGAGHDAQIMTRLADVGMIFVRCRDGVSHSPVEYVTPRDAFLGARVMYEAALRLGRE
jgi:allantoate deiminase